MPRTTNWCRGMVARTDLTRVRRYGFVITDIHKLNQDRKA